MMEITFGLSAADRTPTAVSRTASRRPQVEISSPPIAMPACSFSSSRTIPAIKETSGTTYPIREAFVAVTRCNSQKNKRNGTTLPMIAM